jgi:conjugal transfer pilus assembly protein TraB
MVDQTNEKSELAPGSGEEARQPYAGGEAIPDFGDSESVNAKAANKQRMILYGVAGAVAVIGGSLLLFSGDNTAADVSKSAPQSSQVAGAAPDNIQQLGPDGRPLDPNTVGVNMDASAINSLNDANFRAAQENRVGQIEKEIALAQSSGNLPEVQRLQGQLQAEQARRAVGGPGSLIGSQTANANKSSRDAEVARLRVEIENLRRQGASVPRPLPVVAPVSSSVAAYTGRGLPAGGPGGAEEIGSGGNVVKIGSYGGSSNKNAVRTGLIFADTRNYLPPNSIATATVIVGADAATNVRSQSDPIPVVLRVTSDARSVAQQNKVLSTKILGCLVNGAAYADLSSEKVFVKLQKMTCDDGRGGVAVSEVKGFVAFAGKAGVRGRVVSREGAFVLKAFLAGLVGGIGRLGENVANSSLYSPTISSGGSRPPIDLGSIAAGAGGAGVGDAGDKVSKYLIERAEQYQPVVEMPTGIDVEVVFLDGSYVR